MIHYKHSFLIEEINLKFPVSGQSEYLVENKFPIHYHSFSSICQKKEVTITIQSKEGQPYIRRLFFKANNSEYIYEGCSYAVQDILSKINYFYDDLILEVSYLGNIMAVVNFEDISREWMGIKKILLNKYKGELVLSYIKKIDDLLNDEQIFIAQLTHYQHLGWFVKPIYKKFTTEEAYEISQCIETKYGTVEAKETVKLDSYVNPDDVCLTLNASYPKHNKLMHISGKYIFEKMDKSWLKESQVQISERYGLQEYNSSFKILKRL